MLLKWACSGHVFTRIFMVNYNIACAIIFQENICDQANAPSVSSISRLLRSRSGRGGRESSGADYEPEAEIDDKADIDVVGEGEYSPISLIGIVVDCL